MSNNLINKGGFYNLSDFSGDLVIEVSDKVVIFDDGRNEIEKIEILGKTDLKIFGFIQKSRNLEIISIGEKTNSLINYIFLGKNEEKIISNINGKIKKSGNILEINILGLLDDNSTLSLDSGINIEKNISKSTGITNSEIIFLSNKAKFTGIPGLKVSSNDVKANHSLKIDKINDESIFYLQARGLDKENSRNMLLKAKIDELYKILRLCNQNLYEEIINKIFL
ncbi:MAG: SufD family Fe-S cluster assembly protein [Candidatus Gracilibacteria bacterium]|nr:SufD family Fe-S cluster assembly protein [Candidatus Gracilibacteria bacterium]